MNVLLFSRDQQLATLLGRILRSRWDSAWVYLAADLDEAAGRLDAAELVFVDLAAYPRDFARLIQEIREACSGPLVALSDERAGPERQVIALRAGADEVYELPPEPLLYLARIQALLRRTEAARRMRVGRLALLPETAEALVDDRPLALTPREFRLLHALAARAGRIVPVEELIEAVWEGEAVDRSTVRKFIQRLRQKLGAEAGVQIVARPGIGYSLKPVSFPDALEQIQRAVALAGPLAAACAPLCLSWI
uniref:Response regulator transcription factor n=1 Tax=Thermorudis peleae TaxID=1382356 RepID=A0A831X122_9BACT